MWSQLLFSRSHSLIVLGTLKAILPCVKRPNQIKNAGLLGIVIYFGEKSIMIR